MQPAIERTELTAFLSFFRKVFGPTTVHVDNKGIIDGPWRGEMKCIDSRAKKHKSLFERLVTEGNERADELAWQEMVHCWMEEKMAQIRASTVQWRGEEVHAALQNSSSSHCLVKEWKDCEELKPRTQKKVVSRGQTVEAVKTSDGVAWVTVAFLG